jgi:hypothetical protein
MGCSFTNQLNIAQGGVESHRVATSDMYRIPLNKEAQVMPPMPKSKVDKVVKRANGIKPGQRPVGASDYGRGVRGFCLSRAGGDSVRYQFYSWSRSVYMVCGMF